MINGVSGQHNLWAGRTIYRKDLNWLSLRVVILEIYNKYHNIKTNTKLVKNSRNSGTRNAINIQINAIKTSRFGKIFSAI